MHRFFAEHYYSYDEPQNSDIAETMTKVGNIELITFICGAMVLIFQITFMPYDNFKSMQSKYQFTLANGGGKYMFDQGQFNQSIGTDWFRLKRIPEPSKLQVECQPRTWIY